MYVNTSTSSHTNRAAAVWHRTTSTFRWMDFGEAGRKSKFFIRKLSSVTRLTRPLILTLLTPAYEESFIAHRYSLILFYGTRNTIFRVLLEMVTYAAGRTLVTNATILQHIVHFMCKHLFPRDYSKCNSFTQTQLSATGVSIRLNVSINDNDNCNMRFVLNNLRCTFKSLIKLEFTWVYYSCRCRIEISCGFP